jgi:hypothetical protein
MTKAGRLTFGLGAAYLLLFTGLVYLPTAKTRWIHHSGAVIPNGSSYHRYSDRPFAVLGVTGERWLPSGRSEDAAAYHALVIFPLVMPAPFDALSSGNGLIHRDIQKWQVQEGERVGSREKDLEIVYDALWQTIKIEGKSYRLTDGNLFVIRYNQDWQPTVSQLNSIVYQREHDWKVNPFKSLLPNDKLVQQL